MRVTANSFFRCGAQVCYAGLEGQEVDKDSSEGLSLTLSNVGLLVLWAGFASMYACICTSIILKLLNVNALSDFLVCLVSPDGPLPHGSSNNNQASVPAIDANLVCDPSNTIMLLFVVK